MLYEFYELEVLKVGKLQTWVNSCKDLIQISLITTNVSQN